MSLCFLGNQHKILHDSIHVQVKSNREATEIEWVTHSGLGKDVEMLAEGTSFFWRQGSVLKLAVVKATHISDH